ncbi:SusC/RagA family TonB-linked outer membrane protein [Pedobacter panaciterrae]|uniref:SusC/RagA family TonB-linked outer membrane protein n=1 Tax=Pedobacter panaciterrae TaxID=363849 RepID=A0ABU8NFF1_9SPHI
MTAINVHSQTKVTLKLESASFDQVINEIQNQTFYRFVFSERKIPDKKITINIKNEETFKVLDQILSSTNYNYKLLSNNLIVIKPRSNEDQGIDSVKLLDEVIVTALNIKKENRKIGYSVSTIDGSSLTKARESNLAMALEGLVAGLNVSGVNGGPGSSARILLRGTASKDAGPPLFIINGIPIDNTQRGSANEYGGVDYGDGISNINPDDVETITVLKGSSASALYGARAANGVIIITIKSGKKKSGNSVEYNSNFSFDSPVNNTDYQYIYGQGLQNLRPQNIAGAIATGILSWGEKMDGLQSVQINGENRPYVPVKDNIKTFYRTAPAFTNTISLNGGSDKSSYHASASVLDYQSILRNSDLNRKTANLFTSYDLTRKLTLTLNGNYIYEHGKNRSYLSDGPINANYGIAAIATSADQALLAPGYDVNTGAETRWNADEYKTNPYFTINKKEDNSSRDRFISSALIKYDLSNWVFLQGRFGYDISNDHIISIVPTGTAFSINGQGGINALNQSKTSELNTDILLSGNRDITKDLNIDISAGASFRNRRTKSNELTGTQFIIPYLYTIENLAAVSSKNALTRIVTQSAYYTIDLDFKKYLTLSSTGRYDVYSTLPRNSRGIFVPSVSGSFIFSNFLKIKGLDFGKIRASFAQTSGEPAVPYTTQIYYSSDKSINGVPLGNFSRDLPNYNLKPFTLNEFETGINLKLFGNKLDLDFTYFHRITNKEIINAGQSVTTGFTSAYVNLGKTRNTGIETSIQTNLITNKNFSWKAGINASHINNLLISIDGISSYAFGGTYRPLNASTALVVGKSITQIMAYDYQRDKNGNMIIGTDGIPKRGDMKPMGSVLPSYYGGFSNNFQYKSFSLSFLIDYKFGNKILSATETYSYVLGLNKATLIGRETGIVANGVYENGETNTINVPAYNYYPALATNISALAVLNGSFIKLRQVVLGYTFSSKILNKTPFKNVSIDLIGRNLLTILKYTKNIDPESQFSPSLAYAGIEGASLPATRTFGINLNLKFK